jgi:hypothetical protein
MDNKTVKKEGKLAESSFEWLLVGLNTTVSGLSNRHLASAALLYVHHSNHLQIIRKCNSHALLHPHWLNVVSCTGSDRHKSLGIRVGRFPFSVAKPCK